MKADRTPRFLPHKVCPSCGSQGLVRDGTRGRCGSCGVALRFGAKRTPRSPKPPAPTQGSDPAAKRPGVSAKPPAPAAPAAPAQSFRASPAATRLDLQRLTQDAVDRMRALGLSPPLAMVSGDASRLLTPEQVAARDRKPPELTPEQRDRRARQDEVLRRAGIVGGSLVIAS